MIYNIYNIIWYNMSRQEKWSLLKTIAVMAPPTGWGIRLLEANFREPLLGATCRPSYRSISKYGKVIVKWSEYRKEEGTVGSPVTKIPLTHKCENGNETLDTLILTIVENSVTITYTLIGWSVSLKIKGRGRWNLSPPRGSSREV